MAIRIHYNPQSQHARRVHMVGLELDLPIDWRLVDFTKVENQAPAYLALNPNGKVPVLEEDGFVLWESNAILAYLADKKPQAGLYPTDPKQRADVNRWLFWESAHFGPAAVTLTWERVVKPTFMKQAANPVLVEQGEQNWKRFASVLNVHLESTQYVAKSLSIADFSLASILMYRGSAGIDTKSYVHLQRWLDRMESRDSWKKTAPSF